MRKSKYASKIKVKPETNDIIGETALRLGVSPDSIRAEFRNFWIDAELIFSYYMGYGFYFEEFGHFLIYLPGIVKSAKTLEARIIKKQRSLNYLQKQSELKGYNFKRSIYFYGSDIATSLTKIIFLNCAINQYEKDVLGQYPRKYKTDRKNFNAVIARIENIYKIPISKFPVTIDNSFQKVFVQKMQKKGLLPNPIFYKDQVLENKRRAASNTDSKM